MMSDPKASSLVTSFAMKWLNIADLEDYLREGHARFGDRAAFIFAQFAGHSHDRVGDAIPGLGVRIRGHGRDATSHG